MGHLADEIRFREPSASLQARSHPLRRQDESTLSYGQQHLHPQHPREDPRCGVRVMCPAHGLDGSADAERSSLVAILTPANLLSGGSRDQQACQNDAAPYTCTTICSGTASWGQPGARGFTLSVRRGAPSTRCVRRASSCPSSHSRRPRSRRTAIRSSSCTSGSTALAATDPDVQLPRCPGIARPSSAVSSAAAARFRWCAAC